MRLTAGKFSRGIALRILGWYSQSARDLPWRNETNAYRILVSEVMLQQTQVSRVAVKYPRFIKRFPDFPSLARAGSSSVIRAWKGMGYNNRAVRLKRLAETVVAHHRGALPREVEALESLPGIGRYTANAVACFAFGRQVPVVDTNVRRVLGRLFPKLSGRLDVWDLASRALPPRKARDWNQALMDLGSTICTAAKPRCASCPVKTICPSSYQARHVPRTRQKGEASRDGVPNRLYRGRIVESLRNLPRGKSIAASMLGPRVKHSYSPRDGRWLERLLRGLEKDGLIELRQSNRGLAASLPR